MGRRFLSGYPAGMPKRNFADPDYEPSDEDLNELMHEAFDGLFAQKKQSLLAMRARIVAAQNLAREQTQRRLATIPVR